MQRSLRTVARSSSTRWPCFVQYKERENTKPEHEKGGEGKGSNGDSGEFTSRDWEKALSVNAGEKKLMASSRGENPPRLRQILSYHNSPLSSALSSICFEVVSIRIDWGSLYRFLRVRIIQDHPQLAAITEAKPSAPVYGN